MSECDRKETDRKESVRNRSAIVTGASSGIGLAISKMLFQEGYEVYGFGRDFGPAETLEPVADFGCGDDMTQEMVERSDCRDGKIERDVHLHVMAMNLLDTEKVCEKVKEISRQTEVSVLVNAAGVGYYGLHEELSVEQIKALVRTNLELPLILTNRLLRTLKEHKGYIVNISSVTAKKSSPHGCAYGATKAGLSAFGESLFDEARKYGVKVCTIHPDMTRTNLYRNADFTCEEGEEYALLPEEVAEAVRFVLTQREGLVVPEITLKPQCHRIARK